MTQTAWTSVSTPAELVEATRKRVRDIEVAGVLRELPMITLAPGVRLRGGTLEFAGKGVQLTRDNVLDDVTIRAPEHEVAVQNDTSIVRLGTLTLRRVRTTGQVLFLARDAVRSGHVQVFRLTVEAADLRGRDQCPHGYGVDASQGAFTLWNQQPDPASVLTADLFDLAAGSADRPVHGCGIFVGGNGGGVRVKVLRTGEIHADGVFLGSGAIVKQLAASSRTIVRDPRD
jgi:hypothetical protein